MRNYRALAVVAALAMALPVLGARIHAPQVPSFTTSFRIGTNGTAKTKDISCTTTNFNFASISAQTCSTTTITCTGAASGDAVYPRWPASGIGAGLVGMMWVTAADTVSVKFCNVTSSAIDPAALDYGARVTD